VRRRECRYSRDMTASEIPSPDRPARWGLAAKLFVALLLLGAMAVLTTGVLGYMQAREALEATIFNQLSVARQTKARQIETYFGTVRDDLRLLASAKMVAEAMREFSRGFDELERKPLDDGIREKVRDWYGANYLPEVQRLLGTKINVTDYLPVNNATNYLQYHYIVANPHPAARRRLLNDAGDGSAYSAAHATYHPLMREAAATVGFFDFMLADIRTGHIVYGMSKELDFGILLRRAAFQNTNLAAAIARCSGSVDRSTTCLEDFAPYLPSGGQAISFMAAPVIDEGKVIGVLIAQLSIDEIDKVVTGNRRWRQEGFGNTGEAYIVGPDFKVRSGGRLFYEDRERYFAELTAAGEPAEEIAAIRRFDSPVLHQRIETQATRAAISGVDGVGQVVGNLGRNILASWGPLDIPGVKWGIVARIEAAEAFAPVYRLERDLFLVGGLALLSVMAIGAWLSRSLMGPLRELTAGVHRFASGDTRAHVVVRSHDEIGQLCVAFNGMVDEISAQQATIETKNRENEALLLNVLPGPIANRLRSGEQSIADGFANVSVMFADIVGFTELSSELPPQQVVTLLNGLFTRFDQAAQELGIEKIKTVGDAYMAVCGLPTPVPDHIELLVRMAIRMVHITHEHALENRVSLQVRIGINSGPVVAGVIGKSKYIYDLWGDTVNLASRMESTGVPGAIQVTRPVYEALHTKFAFEPRGVIDVKGKGEVEAWLLRL